MFELNGLHLDNWLDIFGWAWIFIETMTRAMKITYALVKDMLETVWETVLIVSYISGYETSCLSFDLLLCHPTQLRMLSSEIDTKNKFYHTYYNCHFCDHWKEALFAFGAHIWTLQPQIRGVLPIGMSNGISWNEF